MRARGIKGLVGLVVIAGCLAVSSVAGAQTDDDEYANVINATIDNPSPGVICDNTGLTVSVTQLEPGSTATFTLFPGAVVLGSATADASGAASFTFDLPAGTSLGQHEVVVSGTNSFGVADDTTIVLNVISCDNGGNGNGAGNGGNGAGNGGNGAGTGNGGSDLARTGTDLGGPLRLGVLVIAGGAALLLAARKRQSSAA